ncbi:MAG: EAL domain-containing protein [Burkholderiales bacterium]|nr:EAL domain-containing protein [Burkholderiales bacterium]MCA3157751.1 EAL domain-containing protein [Burkholderiales bacterium]
MQTQQKMTPITQNRITDGLQSPNEVRPDQLPLSNSILDLLPFPIAYIDTSGIVQVCNHSFSSILKQPRDYLLNKTLFSSIAEWPNYHIERVQTALAHAYSGHESTFALNAQYLTKCHPQFDQGGEIKGAFLVGISGSQQSARLTEFNQTIKHDLKIASDSSNSDLWKQMREFSENIPTPLAYIGSDNHFGYVNSAFAQLVNHSQSSLVKQPLGKFLNNAVIQNIKYQLERFTKSTQVPDKQVLHLPNEVHHWLEIQWIPDYSPGSLSDIRGAYLICTDVTEISEARLAHQAGLKEIEQTLNSIDLPLAIVDSDMRFSFANKTMLEWHQLKSEGFIGKHVVDIFQPEQYKKLLPYIEKAMQGEDVSFMSEFRFPDGKLRWIRRRYVPRTDDLGKNNGFYVIKYDVHDLRMQQRMLQLKQEELRRANWLLTAHINNAPLAAIELDPELRIQRWSDTAQHYFGWRRDEVIGRSIWELNLISADEPDMLARSLALLITSNNKQVNSVQSNNRKDGTKLWCDWYISGLHDEEGQLLSLFIIVQDISHRIQTEARLQQLAAYDSLTGLPNRSSLQFELTQAIDRARRENIGVAAIFIDLDHFKNVNDTLGHPVGDKLLLEVARIMKSCVRQRDLVSRMGGDEFMIVIENASIHKAARYVSIKILSALNQPISVEGQLLSVGASVGIALFPDHGSDAHTLLKNSDMAMYHAKESGKNRFEFYNEKLAQRVEERTLIESYLRVALVKNELKLYYQPRISCKDGTIDGAEALLRWRSPILGEVEPIKFIEVAEETGLIFEIGMWVFRSACIQLSEWQSKGAPISCLSVNFSARQLIMVDLVERISTILGETGCNPHMIEIEITETSMLFDLAAIKRVVSSLKKIGLRIAIDDFGTGFSSLTHLQQLDIDTLKVDQSFVRDMLHDPSDAAITRTVINLGRGLGLKIVAEGVENKEQLEHLCDFGSDSYQGYHFSPAVPADQFEALLLANSR